MAYRLADRILAGWGITKAAGGAYTAQREAYADAWFPFADVMVNRTREIARQMDENLQKVRRLYDQDQAMKAAAAQTFDVSRGREPRGDVAYTLNGSDCARNWFPAGNLRTSTVMALRRRKEKLDDLRHRAGDPGSAGASRQEFQALH